MVARSKQIPKRERPYTEEEFMNLPADSKHYELWEGRLVEIISPSVPHGRISGFIITEINIYLRKNNIGTAYSNDTSFRLGPGTIVGPDVAFVAAGRFTEEPKKEMPFPPDLAVEVISPSDIYGHVDEKIEKYLNAGTRLVWVINPRRNKVTVYRHDDTETTFGVRDELDGEDVLPGFKIRVKDIFPGVFISEVEKGK